MMRGMLVCSTNAGEVLGFDLFSGGVAWTYPYWEVAPPPIRPAIDPAKPLKVELTPPKWKSSPPVIQDGKVVFTAPDADSVHCIRLKDGTGVWRKKRADGDLLLAGVFAGKVLIVGQKSVRALKLSDGGQAWQVDIPGLPSGQGAFSRNVYYLPIKTAKDTSAILAIDLEKGAVNIAGQSEQGDRPWARQPALPSRHDPGTVAS